MTIATYEGIVEHGQIHLKTLVRLPEKLRVIAVTVTEDTLSVDLEDGRSISVPIG